MTENESVLITLQNALECATDDVTREDLEMMVKCLEEIQQYQSIGTIEEFKALKEKSVAKKPNNIPVDDTCIYYENHCPNCDSVLIVRYKCCPKCGQKVDWQ